MQEIILQEPEQARRTFTVSSRGLSDYMHILQIHAPDIAGTILDLGSGPKMQFAHEAHKLFPEAKIVSFDQSFIDIPTMMQPTLPANLFAIGGYFGDLPFTDNSMDLVVSCHAMPLYLEGEEAVWIALNQVLRVLKPGGRAHLAPVAFHKRVDAGLAERSEHELQKAEQCYGADFGSIVSPTIVRIGNEYRETMLTDVIYPEHTDVWERILSSLPGVRYQLIELHEDIIRKPYNWLLILHKL